MRTVKLIAIALGALIALFAALLASVWLFVTPNDYKTQIEQLVKDETGRELALPGAIKLSVFPWIALQLGPASLGNPPGFPTVPFASVKHVALRVKLLPLLLHNQLRIGRIEIDGLDLHLLRNAAGEGNWSGFGGTSTHSAAPSRAAADQAALPDLAGLILKDGRIRYGNLRADHVDFAIGHLGTGIEVPVKFSLELATKPGAPALYFAGNFDFTPEASSGRYRFAALTLRGKIHPRHDGTTIDWTLAAPAATLDLPAEKASIPSFTLHFADARATGSVLATKILGAPTASGSFHLDPLAPREFLDHIGIAAPRTRDAKVLEHLSAAGNFAYASNSLALSKLDLRLDDTHVQGELAIANLATHALTFNLAVDRIDIDRYLSPLAAAPTPPAQSRPSTDPLKTLRLDGRLAIGSARLDGIDMRQLRVGVIVNAAVAHIAPANALLYGGSAAGSITIDDRGATPSIQVAEMLANVDVARVLHVFAKTKRLSGRLNLTARLSAHGRALNAVLRTLNGRLAANLSHGAIEGFDLWSDINRASAVLQGQSLPAAAADDGRTAFDTFKASANIVNGIATTRDLTIVSQMLRVTGRGTTNLLTRGINYRLQASILESPGAGAHALADVPVAVTGTLTAPKVTPDLAGMAKSRFQQIIGKPAEQLKKTLEDKLKNLFRH